MAAALAPVPAVRTPASLPLVRGVVRGMLLATPSFQELDPARKKQMAESMVRVCHAAVSLIQEEMESDREARGGRRLSRAQSAGSDFSGVAAQKVAGTTRDILNAVSFPRFVTELINGVFKAMIDSSTQQMNSFVELLNHVSASLDGFADANVGAARARSWLVEKFPGNFQVPPPDPDADPEEKAEVTLELADGASMPSPEALRTELGLGPDETVPGGDPESLVPFARRQLAKSRQQMLATMVMLGMQRIVVESGRITAAMRFHIDTHSAAQADQGSTLSEKNELTGEGKFGFGPWGASAKMTNTIGYVNTQRSQTTEEMNTDLDLNSSVEINFKSDYLPLNRMTSPGQADRIRSNSINPDEEAKASIAARSAREAGYMTNEANRGQSLDKILAPAAPSPAPAAPAPEKKAAEPAKKPVPDAAPKPAPNAAPKPAGVKQPVAKKPPVKK
jgi:hypothetical protein